LASLSIIFSAFLLFPFLSNAQDYLDDPRYDRVPQWALDSMAKQRSPESTTTITINGWDNFKVGLDFAEGHIVENPQNPVQYFNCYNTTAAHYTNDGLNFNNTTVTWGGSMWGDPVAAYDSLGNLYFENMYGAGTVQGCKVAKSSNNGQNWSTVVNAISGVDKNWICADATGGPYSNYVYTTMTGNSGGNFARSTDLGVSFQNTATMSTQGLPGMMPCVGAYGNVQGGAVYVVTNGGSSTNSTYTFYRSTNGGQNFTQMSSQNWSGYVGTFINSRHSVQNMRTRPYPFITADNSWGPHRGRLYCVYATNDPPGSGNKPDIWSRYSDNGGTTWSAAIRVNDDVNPTSNHQWMPAIWCDKNTGRLYVQWMDTRNVPTSDSCLIYATYSDNGGESFAVNKPISNKKMKINCTTCGGGGTPAYQGDYNGVVSNNSVSMLTWTDFRDGKFDSFVAYYPDYSMFVSPQTVPISGTGTLYAQFPEVKGYTSSVVVTAQAQNPGAGTLTVSYPNGTILNTLPGEVPILVTASPEVPPGMYQILVTAKGVNGTPYHKRTAMLDVQPLGPPVADFEADTTTFCAGTAVNFTDLSTNAPSSWEWSFPGGEPATSTVKNPAGILYSTPGVYSVTLTATNVAGSNTMTMTDFITVNEIPAAPAGDDQEVCQDAVIPDLTVTGDNVSWYSDPELTTLVNTGNTFVTGLTEPGVYPFFVTATLGDCVSESDTVTLTINALPEVTLAAIDSLCQDAGAFTLAGGLPEGGVFSGTGVDNGTFDPMVSGIGTFDITYTFTDTNGCVNSTVQQVTVISVPTVDLGADADICSGTSKVLDAGTGDYTYLWSTGATDQTIEVAEAGEYSVLIANEFGCSDTDTINIAVLPLPGVSSAPTGPATIDNFMISGSQFTSTGAENAATYQWSLEPAGAGTINGTGLTASVSWVSGFAGAATITLYGINDCGNGEVSGAFTVTLYTSQGVDENAIGKIHIYPNPNKGTFSLDIQTVSSKSLDISLTNALGETVYRRENLKVDGDAHQVITTGNAASGMMILKVSDGQNTWTGKVFIEK
jgi:PKD repeat protein